MSREIDYKKVFNTLDYLVDGSANYYIHSEKRDAFRTMAYKYKEAICSYASNSKYFEQDLETFNRWKDNVTDSEFLEFHCHFYCPWLEDEFVSQTEPDEDGNYTMTWKETSYTGKEYQTVHNLFT